jgi:hypothetical protein
VIAGVRTVITFREARRAQAGRASYVISREGSVVANISFPCSGISHTDYVGEIPIGPARSFGIIDTPPFIGEVGTGPVRAC